MLSASLLCPQCGAPLPRQALWRTVDCPYCGVVVTRLEHVVHAAPFRAAGERARQIDVVGARIVRCAGQAYRILTRLGQGRTAQVYLAERAGVFRERVILKLSHDAASAQRLQREHAILVRLQADRSPGAAYFSQRLPQPVAQGRAVDHDGRECVALILREAPGFWGSLADVATNYPQGIDPRHAVWMWRRVLEVLGYLHPLGWVHGDLTAAHLLVHPDDHGILITGWADARYRGDGGGQTTNVFSPARDLMQVAWTLRTLLRGDRAADALTAPTELPAATPPALASLLRQASEDADWCARLGAAGLDAELQSVARAAFGTPRFIEFKPVPAR